MRIPIALSATLAIGLATALLAAQDGKPAARSATPPAAEAARAYKIGEVLDAEIALPDIDGKRHRLADLRAKPAADGSSSGGKVVVLDFWSIQCPVSKAYEERLKKLAADFSGKDVVFYAIDANVTEVDRGEADPYARIRAYVKEQKIPYTILIDEGNRFADRLAAQTTPHVYILDRAGTLAYAGAIDDDQRENKGAEATHYVRTALEELLAGKPVTKAETKAIGCSIKRAEKGSS